MTEGMPCSYIEVDPNGGYRTRYDTTGKPKPDKVFGQIIRIGETKPLPLESRLDGEDVQTEIEVEVPDSYKGRPVLHNSGLRKILRKEKRWIIGKFPKKRLYEDGVFTSTTKRTPKGRIVTDRVDFERGDAYEASITYRS